MRIYLLYGIYSVIIYFIINDMRFNYYMDFIQWLWILLFMHHVKTILSQIFVHWLVLLPICSLSLVLIAFFFHCFHARSIWFIADRDRVSMFCCPCRVIFFEYVMVFMHYVIDISI